ncbi:hypothetical protein LOTGIDRAFT_165499 [Lottia gigantea]|uniref:Uncharacterized protein n=1 Tax=Lottia gigantea TaxID=225164 RepID=V4A1A5_LOTGI|nr:hypothetical protein LOTGIDRAFT_165499 [Lottia gigantea]ESO88715.1 hypothetical protein LOTGIDRAFT_165499 [Lottia gigantea]
MAMQQFSGYRLPEKQNNSPIGAENVKKCGTPTCHVCGAPRLPPDIFAELDHLPDPIPEPGSGSYQHFDDLYGKVETTEKFLPSAKATPEKGNKCPFNPTAQTAKNVGTVIQCADCGKWRCMHSKRMLKKKDRDELGVVLDSILYSCGSSFQGMCHSDEEGDNQNNVLNHVFVRANLNCRTEMEYTYYSANYEAVCIYCASSNPQQKEGYYPQCEDCTQKPTVPKRGAKK